MTFRVSITKQARRRKLGSGHVVVQTRYFVNYYDPKTGKRKLPSFERQKDAVAFRNQLLASVETGTYAPQRKVPTVAEAVDHWLEVKQGQVRSRTFAGYADGAKHIVGPLLSGTAKQRAHYTLTGARPGGTKLVPLLGDTKLSELTTGDIRSWHMTIRSEISLYAANRAKMFLAATLALAEEDFGVRTPRMPTQLGRGGHKVKKPILSLEEIAGLLVAAREDKQHGIYYAFPFLAGTRPGEQLALLWEDVDFDRNVINIRRTQENDGTIANVTKTEAGMREVPMCSVLREMLLEWRVACPRRRGELHRVFPGPGRLGPWPSRRSGGGALRYQNFRNRVWVPMLRRLDLPHVTPHSARHSFISTLQAQGIEVGLVAKLAGHANPAVTLGHYTQAVRGGEAALAALERAYCR
jgi:integrase